MKIRKLHRLPFWISLWIGVFLGACIRGDEFAIPPLPTNPTPDKTNITIQKLKRLHTGRDWKQIQEDLIIEGIVTANDKQNNFFKEIFIQDTSGGLRVKINQEALFKKYPLGQKIEIYIKGLYLNNNFGEIQLGEPYTDKENNQKKFGGINKSEKHLIKIDGGEPLPPSPMNIEALNDAQIGSLARLEKIQFSQEALSKTYADTKNKKSAALELIDCQEKTVSLYTSGRAQFAQEKPPNGNGHITGILTKFKDVYQLMIRDLDDIQMEGPRCNRQPSS